MVVKPFTPDDSVSSSGSASRSRTSPTMATSGAMRRNPATSRRRSTSGRSGRAGRVCMLATFGSGMSASNTSSAMTTRSAGVELGRAARQHRGLARAGCAREDDRQPRPHARPQERRRPWSSSMSRSTSWSSARNGTPVNLRMLTMHVAVAARRRRGRCGGGRRCRAGRPGGPRRGRACGGAGGVVEDLGERPHDVVVVVEDLVVVAAGAPGGASRRSASGALIMISQTSSSARRGSSGP